MYLDNIFRPVSLRKAVIKSHITVLHYALVSCIIIIVVIIIWYFIILFARILKNVYIFNSIMLNISYVVLNVFRVTYMVWLNWIQD